MMSEEDKEFWERIGNHDANQFLGSLIIGCILISAAVVLLFFILNSFNLLN
jgi:hypothetical protein